MNTDFIRETLLGVKSDDGIKQPLKSFSLSCFSFSTFLVHFNQIISQFSIIFSETKIPHERMNTHNLYAFSLFSRQ